MKSSGLPAAVSNHSTIAHDFGLGLRTKTAGTYQGTGRQANEAVAAKALPTHHRFKQEAVLATVLGVGELEVERERGFQVGKGFEHQRDAVVALASQAFEFKFGDHG